MSEWEPPRCAHGKILLGCPNDDCEEQNAYLAAQREAQKSAREQLDRTARLLFAGKIPQGLY